MKLQYRGHRDNDRAAIVWRVVQCTHTLKQCLSDLHRRADSSQNNVTNLGGGAKNNWNYFFKTVYWVFILLQLSSPSVIPRLTKIIRSGITFVSRNLR